MLKCHLSLYPHSNRECLHRCQHGALPYLVPTHGHDTDCQDHQCSQYDTHQRYTTLYCHSGIMLTKYLSELTKALHDKELFDYKMSIYVLVSIRDYEYNVVIALTKK